MNVVEEQDESESVPATDSIFGTETMAELCVRQGRVSDAMAIYRGLLAGPADNPRRARWLERLALLKSPEGGAALPRAMTGNGLSGPLARAPAPTSQRSTLGSARGTPTGAGAQLSTGAMGLRPAIHRLPRVIREPVRSGQIVYAEKNDLIVLAPVNPGAQLIADGNIHIYSRLRGRAVAGAHGETSARIFCQKLDAELVGIDTAYLIADDIPGSSAGLPAQIFLQDGRCVIAPL